MEVVAATVVVVATVAVVATVDVVATVVVVVAVVTADTDEEDVCTEAGGDAATLSKGTERELFGGCDGW